MNFFFYLFKGIHCYFKLKGIFFYLFITGLNHLAVIGDFFSSEMNFFMVVFLQPKLVVRSKLTICWHLSLVPWIYTEELDLPAGIFRLEQIISATNDFSFDNKVGEGGFGPLYKVFQLTIK